MTRAGSTHAQRKAFRLALAESLRAGYEVLKAGGEAMDAAVAAVSVMEDNPLFNAGKGAVFNTAGKNELEASIMLSKSPATHPEIPTSRRGLGLTLLTRARNPSKHARALYLRPDLVEHTFISGETAQNIGSSLGEELVDPAYFFTEHRWKEHRRGLGLPEEPLPDSNLIDLDDRDHTDSGSTEGPYPLDMMPKGTVGAVALDVRECIAAVTSTGGRTNKLPGRIGDTPLMGAGFWAEEWDNEGESILPAWLRGVWNLFRPQSNATGKVAVGVSGTGDGDYFIRQATASTIARRMQLGGESVSDASEKVIQDLLQDGGIGGAIALDSQGNVALPLNSPGMYRGVIRGDGIPKVAIFKEDELEEVKRETKGTRSKEM
ncbi:L-asparaginase [Coprinellus micaceus]|uniref:L-asparaginase n=1 Tax=Coprinellus micaceus TaxID=71717 RepID=A0A4Y7T524_COPMI|nr:L-asparaginase [Coprinellus micaceus]